MYGILVGRWIKVFAVPGRVLEAVGVAAVLTGRRGEIKCETFTLIYIYCFIYQKLDKMYINLGY